MEDDFDRALSEFLAVDKSLADFLSATGSGSARAGGVAELSGSPNFGYHGYAHGDNCFFSSLTPKQMNRKSAFESTSQEQSAGMTQTSTAKDDQAYNAQTSEDTPMEVDQAPAHSQLCHVSRINFAKTQHRQFALTRPLFFGNRIIIGTEYPLDPTMRFLNAGKCGGLVLGEWKVPWTSPIVQETRSYEDEFVATEKLLTDVQWVIPGEVCAYASETDVQLCRWDKRRSVVVDYSEEAKVKGGIEIRQIAVHDSRLVTGDSEKRVRVFALGEQRAESGMILDLPMADTVGSVAWSPFSPDVVTYTLDHGALGMIDTREGGHHLLVPMRATSENRRLFAHCAVSQYIYALGYEDAKGRTIDIRAANSNKGGISRWADLELKHIGEFIRPANLDSKLTVACGIGGFSVYDFSDGKATSLESVQTLASIKDVHIVSDCYKTSGAFVPGYKDLFALTDTAGYLSFYDLSHLA